MRIVIQRVSKASVKCESGHSDDIGQGMLIFLGIEKVDSIEDIDWLVQKIAGLRIFSDQKGQMNLSLKDINGEVLLISQFTLHASTRKGNRPSWFRAADPEVAVPLYNEFISRLSRELNMKVKQGVFGDHMDVSLINDGPVTIIIDSKNKE